MKILSILLSVFLISTSLFAAPNEEDGTEFFVDYLPKYRSANTAFLVSKIKYKKETVTLYFRYVSQRNFDAVQFYGKENDNAWIIASSAHVRANTLVRKIDVKNVRINDESKSIDLAGTEEKELFLNKGDILTGELHFDVLPKALRSMNLLRGAVDKMGMSRFSCLDILLKSNQHKALGTVKQMNANIGRFYSKLANVRYPDIKEVVDYDVVLKEAKAKKTAAPEIKNSIQSSLGAIKYMPKTLNSIKDLKCQQRLILKNVYFVEGRSEYQGRIKAMRTLNILVDYLKYRPNDKVVLHGHTDIFGNAFKNLDLSKRRVLTVKRSLRSKGIDPSRVITVHHGGAQPLPNYKEGGAINRRVEIEIICGDK